MDANAPLTGADVDLRGLPFMPLVVQDLRDSDLAMQASPEAFRASVLLWCASWHQIPAGSLPYDDVIICRLAGCDLKIWKKIKEEVLKDFILCWDGRYYHPKVAELALEAHQRRTAYNERAAKARAAKAATKLSVTEPVTEPVTTSVTEPVTESRVTPNDKVKRQGQGQRQRQRQGQIDYYIGLEAREPDKKNLISKEAYELAEKLRQIQNLDRDDPRCVATGYTCQSWLTKGWKSEIIQQTVDIVVAQLKGNGREVPSALRYYEKAIAMAHAEAERPLPIAKSYQPSNGKLKDESTSALAAIRAINRQIEDKDDRKVD